LPLKHIELSIIKDYFNHYPEDAAFTLETFPVATALTYLEKLPIKYAISVFSYLNPDKTYELIKQMNDTLFTKLFSKLDTRLGARLLSQLEKEDIQKKCALLPELVSREIEDFMTYQHDTAGYLMETVVTTFKAENTVQEVLQRIRQLKKRRINTIYMVNNTGELIGKIPLQVIAVSQPDERLQLLVENAPSVSVFASQDEVLEFFEKGKLLQLPVTDTYNRLLGIIRNETLFNVAKDDATADLQTMFGAGREEHALSKISFAVKKRLPWLQINLATAFLASLVVGFFEDTIAKMTILAVFLPVVAGQSGNTGSQALAVAMRGLALREIKISDWFKVVKKELWVGLINGIAVAITTGAIVYFWSDSIGIAIVIAISMIISMMIAGFFGAGIPIFLKAVGQDPATSSSIILTTVTDICGFLSFLGLATALASVFNLM